MLFGLRRDKTRPQTFRPGFQVVKVFGLTPGGELKGFPFRIDEFGIMHPGCLSSAGYIAATNTAQAVSLRRLNQLHQGDKYLP
jgi:hypothetical protein